MGSVDAGQSGTWKTLMTHRPGLHSPAELLASLGDPPSVPSRGADKADPEDEGGGLVLSNSGP